MAWWKKALVGGAMAFGAAGLGCVGGGLLLPAELALSTSQRLAAPPEAVRPLLTTADGVARWWDHAATLAPPGTPPMEVAHAGGPAEGPGLVVAFRAGGVTAETWTLREARADAITWEVDFGVFAVERTFTLVPENAGGTIVGWEEAGRIGNPVARWLPLLMPAEDVVANFDLALGALGAVAGAPPEG